MSEVCNLAILEYLIQSNGYMRSADLWTALFSKFQHCPAMLSVIGPNPDSLEAFVRHQPALFHVSNGHIYSDCDLEPKSASITLPRKHSFDFGENMSSNNLVKPEMEAVRYFQEHLLRIPDKWVPIKSLAVHLSEACSIVRMVVGSPSNFINFIIRFPSFFQVKGNLVGLTDQLSGPTSHGGATNVATKQRKPRPLSYHHGVVDESHQFSILDGCALPVHIPSDFSSSGPGNSTINVPPSTDIVALSLDECKAILWLTHIIKSANNTSISLNILLSLLSNAPKTVHSSIGWTQIELVEFLKKYNRIFTYVETEQSVQLNLLTKVQLLLVKKLWNSEKHQILLAQKGCIFCVNRLWGIIDLGFHEHVFFDRSLFKHVTDLSSHFKIREPVFFNAVLASKESRAKWRATCVWKETDLSTHLQRWSSVDSPREEVVDDTDSGLDNSEDTGLKEHFEDVEEAYECCSKLFAAIRLADAWEVHSKHDNIHPNSSQPQSTAPTNSVSPPVQGRRKSTSFAPCSLTDSPNSESSTLSGIPSISDGVNPLGNDNTTLGNDPDLVIRSPGCSCNGNAPKKLAMSVSTQTLFTGDIMATKLYHDDSS